MYKNTSIVFSYNVGLSKSAIIMSIINIGLAIFSYPFSVISIELAMCWAVNCYVIKFCM